MSTKAKKPKKLARKDDLTDKALEILRSHEFFER